MSSSRTGLRACDCRGAVRARKPYTVEFTPYKNRLENIQYRPTQLTKQSSSSLGSSTDGGL